MVSLALTDAPLRCKWSRRHDFILDIHFVRIKYPNETTTTMLTIPIAAICLGENASEYRNMKIRPGAARHTTETSIQTFCSSVRFPFSKSRCLLDYLIVASLRGPGRAVRGDEGSAFCFSCVQGKKQIPHSSRPKSANSALWRDSLGMTPSRRPVILSVARERPAGSFRAAIKPREESLFARRKERRDSSSLRSSE